MSRYNYLIRLSTRNHSWGSDGGGCLADTHRSPGTASLTAATARTWRSARRVWARWRAPRPSWASARNASCCSSSAQPVSQNQGDKIPPDGAALLSDAATICRQRTGGAFLNARRSANQRACKGRPRQPIGGRDSRNASLRSAEETVLRTREIVNNMCARVWPGHSSCVT